MVRNKYTFFIRKKLKENETQMAKILRNLKRRLHRSISKVKCLCSAKLDVTSLLQNVKDGIQIRVHKITKM